MDSLISLACVVVCLVWTGRRPSSAKVACTILVFTALIVGCDSYLAMSLGTTPAQMFKDAALESARAMASMGAIEQEGVSQVENSLFLLDCWIAFIAIYVTVFVIIGMCLRWIYERIRHITTWSPFSKVDLSPWWSVPLILAIVMYTVVTMMGATNDESARALVLSVFMVSLIPLFFQGAAVGKGILNNMGVSFAWQLCLGVFALMLMVPVLVFPLMGLIDFWANFRRLERADARPHGKPED
ncbi:MAG: hypothetical protein ACOX69_02605 [Coriobacteriales bacterium]